jgi:GPH family glycoside/pentoside/hexuronide:cation symporter
MTTGHRGLPRTIKVGWAVGELGIATFIGLTMIYLLYFLTQAIGIPPLWAGIALLIPRLWDVLIDPVIGALSDHTRSRMGRRRPYVLAAACTFGPLFALLFAVPSSLSDTGKAVYVTLLYLLASTAYSLLDVPFSAMAAEFTNDYKERTNLTGYKMIAARAGIVLSVTLGPLIFGSQNSLAAGFRLLGYVSGAFIVATTFTTFLATRRAPRIERPVHRFSVRDELNSLRGNRPFRVLWLAFLFQNLAIGASATTLIYLITFVMKADAKIVGPLIAIGSVVGLVVTPLWVLIARRLGKRNGYFVGMVISALMSLPALIIPPELYLLLFIVLLVAGVGDAATQLFPNSMVPDTVEVDELRTGVRREGAIFGAWSFCRKLGMAGGAFFVSIGLSAVGFVSGVDAAAQSPGALAGIRLIYALVPCALWALAMIVLWRYELSEVRFNEIKTRIQSKGPDELAGRDSAKAGVRR